MCLAIPAQLVGEPNDIQMAEVDILGVRRLVSVMMTPAARSGDFVLVHAGFAIEIVDEQFAAESLELLREIGIKDAAQLEAEAAEEEARSADGVAS